MMTFRKLIGKFDVTKVHEQQSPLEQWFEQVIDTTLNELSVEDLCRAIRQELYIDQLMPRVLDVMQNDPLAGEYYDGELIAALSTVKEKDLKDQKSIFIQIQKIINNLSPTDVNDDLRKDILKINKIIT
ncbi:TPA: hypothetical protein QEG37_005297 [Pluralibacter gergoviae]|nr:hypothetical protein [Pluralibacter gergoviae]HDS1244646.1 hypothetical protein [Pluralibacter gergoviae]HDS1250050.1 hypothetical protein [Pluralibacter gergoviae]HDS1255586.1 hypothetical protein [Pluralibacter gergoviae]HDS1261160.1 hypothetical protein [Pluralibacter gergoviae]